MKATGPAADSTPTLVMVVAGTWGLKPESPRIGWWRAGPWIDYMRAHGIAFILDPFIWSTDLGHRAWIAGAMAAYWWIKLYWPAGVPLRIVCHSHGWQLVQYLAAMGTDIDTVFSFGSPMRHDMEAVLQLARPHITHWFHVRAKEWDKMEWGGQQLDGEWQDFFDWRRDNPSLAPDLMDTVPGIAHSKVFYEPEWFHMWEDLGWSTLLRQWK